MCMSDEQHRSWESVLGNCDSVAEFWEDGGIVINISNSDVDLCGAVNRRGVGEGLQNQQSIWLRFMVQRFDVADQARLWMD